MTTDVSYVSRYIPRGTLEKLEAGAYEQLCEHLRQRSEEVQNIDLMTISGFCRNCLAKWLVVEARRMSDQLKNNPSDDDNVNTTIQALDALGYDEAAEYVYGMGYGDWKKRYAKKATDEIMEKYNASKDIHAKHDKNLLATRGEKPTTPIAQPASSNSTLLSNVCCQDPELVAAEKAAAPPKKIRAVTPQVPPPPPGITQFKMAILTISDRASSGEYKTGDLSGPAVADSVAEAVKTMNNQVECDLVQKEVVPDNVEAIQGKLKEWSEGSGAVDLILTTGGTGFAPRDVTPEATTAVLDQECHGLMAYIGNECARIQPLAALSRGTAGVRGRTLIANLPGNPKGVREIVPLLLPLALHAIVDLQKQA